MGNNAKTSDKKFLKLCKHGSVQEISDALKDDANPNAKGKVYGYTALMNAAEQNKAPEVIATLLNVGADINDKDTLGMTALKWAQ